MRIVDVCAFYAPQGGGVKTYVNRKLRAGVTAGHDITILVPGLRPDLVEVGPSARILSITGRRFPLDLRYRYFHDEAALHRALDNLNPDLVEASSPWGSATMVGRWPGPALRALVMHADPLSAYAYRWFGGIASRSTIDKGFDWFWQHLRRLDLTFDLVVSASRHLTDRLQAGGLNRLVTVPMGVEPGVFSPAWRDQGLRSRLLARCGLTDDALLLLGVGRFAPEKRWPMVIDAVTAAAIEHPIGLILVGNGRDKARILRSTASNPHVHLLAPIDNRIDLARLLASADALVHGCEAETFGMVVSEARASGLPVIVPNQGGASDQFVTGQGATYCAADVRSLAVALKDFVARGPREQRRRAVRDAIQVRSMDEHFDDLFRTYALSIGEDHRAAC